MVLLGGVTSVAILMVSSVSLSWIPLHPHTVATARYKQAKYIQASRVQASKVQAIKEKVQVQARVS